MADVQENSQTITRGSGSNFVSSFWFLPPEKRAALTAIYAWCRLTDDIVDAAVTPEQEKEARLKMGAWRAQTLGLYEGRAEHPVLRDLSGVVRLYPIPPKYFEDLIEGVLMDLDRKSYAAFADLRPYCYRVASVVGLMCLEVFGYKNPRSREFAEHLGIAFQLTNIIRDVKTDAGRGRVYLPEEDLRKFGFSREDMLTLADEPLVKEEKINRFKALIAFECERAESFYRQAHETLPREDRPNMVAAEVMASVYHCILRKVLDSPMAVLAGKVKPGKAETLFRVLQGYVSNKFFL